MGPRYTGTPLLVTSDGRHWRPVQTCSFQTLGPLNPSTPTEVDIWWLLKHVQSAKRVVRILLECFLVFNKN